LLLAAAAADMLAAVRAVLGRGRLHPLFLELRTLSLLAAAALEVETAEVTLFLRPLHLQAAAAAAGIWFLRGMA
jgi:hypothetical protein